MPEQEIKKKKSCWRFWLFFALLVLIFASKSFSWIEVKKDKEPEFNYSPDIQSRLQRDGIGNLRPFLLRRLFRRRQPDDYSGRKNSEDLLPMASITKLTAIVAYKNYNLEEEITMSQKVNDWPDSSKRFIPGTVFKISELLRALLIESNNDAAMALAGKMGLNNFLATMNEEAQDWASSPPITTIPSELTRPPKRNYKLFHRQRIACFSSRNNK